MALVETVVVLVEAKVVEMAVENFRKQNFHFFSSMHQR
jgi:hypothetical protein